MPVEPLEQPVLQEIGRLLNQPSLLLQINQKSREQEPALDYDQTIQTLQTLNTIWSELFTNEQQRLAQLLIKRIEVKDSRTHIQTSDGQVIEAAPANIDIALIKALAQRPYLAAATGNWQPATGNWRIRWGE